MTLIADYHFSESSSAVVLSDSDTAGPTQHDGTYMNGAAANGSGSGVFDGVDDYAVIDKNPAFGMSEGTIIIDFTQDTSSTGHQPWGDNPAQTLFSVDSTNRDGGGHLTIFIRANGQVTVRHQTDSSDSFFSGGDVTLGQPTTMSYSWGPSGSTLTVDGTVVAQGSVTINGTSAQFMSGDVEPITIGASQAESGNGVADNLTGFFDGQISRVQIHDQASADTTPVPCFVAGTHILTPRGDMPVEELAPGDLVITADHGPLPLIKVHRRTVREIDILLFPKLRPVFVPRGTLGNARDLRLSRQHCMLLTVQKREVLVRAAHLAKFGPANIKTDHEIRPVTYVHLQFKDHTLIFAEGSPCESLLPGAKVIPGDTGKRPGRTVRPILTGAQSRCALIDRPCITARPLQKA